MNLVIITSLLKVDKTPLSYCKTRSIYSVTERYSQVLTTINSVRKYIPNAYIILLECSNNIENYELELRKYVDEYYNYCNNVEIVKEISSPYKGVGEAYQILGLLKSYDISRFNSIIKISGRYFLNNSFTYSIFDNNENIFRGFDNLKVVSTRLYKIDKYYFEKFINILNSSISYMRNGESIESTFYKLVTYKNIDYLGLSGNVAVSGDYINE